MVKGCFTAPRWAGPLCVAKPSRLWRARQFDPLTIGCADIPLVNQGEAYEWMAASFLPDRVSVSFVVALAAAMIACSPWNSARAFDFFGLWGSDESPPPVSRTAISYSVTVDVRPGDRALTTAIKDASSVYKLRTDPPPDGDALARRGEGDFGPIIDAMWGAGYYDAAVTISIDRAQSEHSVQRHRGLCPRRRGVPQPRRRTGDHRGRSRPALQPAIDQGPRPGRRGAFGGRVAGADRPPQARRFRRGGRPARGGGADRRLFPRARAGRSQGSPRSLRWLITPLM